MKSIVITQKVTSRESEAFKTYLKDVSKIKQLTADEEFELAKKASKGDLKAREELINKNLRFVVSVAKQYSSHKIPLEDLVNEGNIGLIKAAERFEPTLGYKFISYAVWWIRKEIMAYLTNHGKIVKIPTNKITKLAKLDRLVENAEQIESRPVSITEFFGDPNIDLTDNDLSILSDLSSYRLDSFDKPISSEDGSIGTLYDIFVDDDAKKTDEFAEGIDLGKYIGSMLNLLTEKEQYIINVSYGLNGNPELNLFDAGERIGVSREMARQIRNKALKKLKRVINPHLV